VPGEGTRQPLPGAPPEACPWVAWHNPSDSKYDP
jgi:hypothetical protein